MYQQGLVSIWFVTGPERGQTVSLTKQSVIIGRDPTQCDVVTKDPTVSAKHIRLYCNNNVWTIEQIKKNTVVTINTQQIQQANVKDSDTIGIGKDTTFSLFITLPIDKTQIALPPEHTSHTFN